MSLLPAISHKYVLSRIVQRTPHNTGCGCDSAIFFLTLPKR